LVFFIEPGIFMQSYKAPAIHEKNNSSVKGW